MPTAVLETPDSAEIPRKRWTRTEFDILTQSGMLGDQRLELVCGELLSKMGKNRPHVNSLVLLQGWLIAIFGFRKVNPEAPIDVAPEDNPTNEPEPDLIVLKQDLSMYLKGNPKPAELELVVEISESSLKVDLTTKASLYARAEIVEYWVLDIPGRRMIVHREPRDGRYQSVQAYDETESVIPLAAPHASAPVASFLT